MAGRRQFGSLRRLPSGRWQARLEDPATGRSVSLGSFTTKADADRTLALTLADRTRGAWVDPRQGRLTLGEYAPRWIESRPRSLRPRTREAYDDLLRLHVLPAFERMELGRITTASVRTWHATLLRSGHQVTAAKAYRLLRAILATAVEDELIARNPCIIKGAGVERSPERPVATIAQVYELASAVDERFRALVLMATLTGLRQGELFALRRRHLDLMHATVAVVDQVQTMRDGSRLVGPPKSEAGRRTVCLPPVLVGELESHLASFVGSDPDNLVFVGAKGAPLRRGLWNGKWRSATRKVGVPELHFHDLRHTGNTLVAATGASTRELMARMGHASPRAALIYQHATRERDEAIARALRAC